MLNWCKRHECFEICPECNREREERYGLQSTVAERHPPKLIAESNPTRAAAETRAEVIELDTNGKPTKCKTCGEPLVDGHHLPDLPEPF